MSDDSLKSAYDLAMDRLRAKDREEGVEESKPLTAQQKKTIADLRAKAKAKLAEMEILNGKDRGATMGDPEKLAELEQNYLTDRRRVQSSLESAIARVRRGKEPGPVG